MPDHVLKIPCTSIDADYLMLDTTPDDPDESPPIAALQAYMGSDRAQVNLSPETARTLGEALVAWADDPPVKVVAYDRNGAEIRPGDKVLVWMPDTEDVVAVAKWTGEKRGVTLVLDVLAHRSSTEKYEGEWRPSVLTKVIA